MSDASPSDRLLDVATVARKLGVSDRTVRNWIHAGILTADRQPGGFFKVRSSAVAACLERKSEKSEGPTP